MEELRIITLDDGTQVEVSLRFIRNITDHSGVKKNANSVMLSVFFLLIMNTEVKMAALQQ